MGLPVLKVFCRCLLHTFFLSVKLERVPVWKKKLELLKRFKGVALGALMNPGLQRMRIRRVAKGIVMGSAEFAFLANFFHSFVTAP